MSEGAAPSRSLRFAATANAGEVTALFLRPDRADHLGDVAAPMLFVQGTRDRLADLDRLAPITARLGDGARLHVIEGGDHGFAVLKRSGRRDEDVLAEIGDAVSRWASPLIHR